MSELKEEQVRVLASDVVRLRAELAEANRTIDTLRAGDAHKLGEVFALREIASKVGTTGVTYHAIIKEVSEWKDQLAEAKRIAVSELDAENERLKMSSNEFTGFTREQVQQAIDARKELYKSDALEEVTELRTKLAEARKHAKVLAEWAGRYADLSDDVIPELEAALKWAKEQA